MSKNLTEKQSSFLSVLFDEAGGDVVKAKLFMARNAPRAAMAMVSGITDPTELGIKEKMSAAKELLDRSGLVKTEKLQVESSGGIMLLPAKNTSDDD